MGLYKLSDEQVRQVLSRLRETMTASYEDKELRSVIHELVRGPFETINASDAEDALARLAVLSELRVRGALSSADLDRLIGRRHDVLVVRQSMLFQGLVAEDSVGDIVMTTFGDMTYRAMLGI